ncbi:MAG TPA: peptide ABC transporter substrate-binding protein [Gemmatimonadaceae bacterium]|nr:peptide ABC transporter substrate-binding protein [Gemmatimonadaceae bacterium]
MKVIVVLMLAYFAAACGGGESPRSGADGDVGGTLIIAMPDDPGPIFPPFAFATHARLIYEQIYDHLADVGPEMNTIGDAGFTKELAENWTWSDDSLSIAFHLNPRARWHDGRKVTARDVAFTIALYKNPELGGQTVDEHARVDSVTTPDSLTVVFWFATRSPLQFLDAAAQVPILPAHVLEGIPVAKLRSSNVPLIGSGRFRLKRWDRGSSGELVADTANYRGRAKLDRVIWTTTASTSAVAKLLGGEADLFDALRPEDVRQISRDTTLRVITLPGLDYAFLAFNFRDPGGNRPHPLFGNRELRRAIGMSVNRAAIVRNILDTFAVVPVGPTVRAYPTTDSTVAQLPYDTARARRALDSLGWTRSGGSGIRNRSGRPLAFTVIVPSARGSRKRAAVLIQEQLRRAGIRMEIEEMDYAAFEERLRAGKFDAALGAWNMGSTPGATRVTWATSGISKSGLNFGSYSNPLFDAAVDSALNSDDASLARALFTKAYRTINDDAPAIWLFEPKTVIAIHRRIRPTAMRTGAWWTDLASWSIPAAERLGRDQALPER